MTHYDDVHTVPEIAYLHQPINFGPGVIISLITSVTEGCVGKKIMYHYQRYNDVFLITLKECKKSESKLYEKSLREVGFDVMVLTIELWLEYWKTKIRMTDVGIAWDFGYVLLEARPILKCSDMEDCGCNECTEWRDSHRDG